jgi:hypothetical protein
MYKLFSRWGKLLQKSEKKKSYVQVWTKVEYVVNHHRGTL